MIHLPGSFFRAENDAVGRLPIVHSQFFMQVNRPNYKFRSKLLIYENINHSSVLESVTCDSEKRPMTSPSAWKKYFFNGVWQNSYIVIYVIHKHKRNLSQGIPIRTRIFNTAILTVYATIHDEQSNKIINLMDAKYKKG